jgi:phosphoribosylformylglycinamidine synthase PurS subunit
MKARVFVSLKPGVHDPQGETIRRALETLGYSGIAELRQGKFFEISLEASSRNEAEATLREIAERVLSNPVIESFRIELQG